MNERNIELEKLEGEVPEELQREINKMQRRERMYTFAVAGALSIAILFGFNWYRGQQSDFTAYSYNNSAGYVSNSSSGSAGGGCCSPGGGAGATAVGLGTAQQGALAGGGGCGSSGGGCGSGGAGLAPTDLATVEEQGLSYYSETYKDSDVVAQAKDYGCHVQCDIVKDGEVIKSFSYRNGQLFEI